jgi:hypothetical protein
MVRADHAYRSGPVPHYTNPPVRRGGALLWDALEMLTSSSTKKNEVTF